MHVITYRHLREYGKTHSDCQEALDNWYKVAQKADWSNLVEVQSVFPSAEAVRNFTVFNIKGNKYRLIVSIDYEWQVIVTVQGVRLRRTSPRRVVKIFGSKDKLQK